MNKFLLVALIALTPSFALAGGGGSSKDNVGTVQVNNKNTTLKYAVAVNPSASLLAATNVSEFTSRGGKIIEARGGETFKNLKAGSATVYSFRIPAVPPATVNVNSFTKTAVTVVKGKTTTVDLL